MLNKKWIKCKLVKTADSEYRYLNVKPVIHGYGLNKCLLVVFLFLIAKRTKKYSV